MSSYPRNYGLDILYERDASLRAFQIVFVDSRGEEEIGGMVYVPDKWMKERNLSIERNGMIFHTLMTIFAAYWTNTIIKAGLGYIPFSPPHYLIDGVDISGSRIGMYYEGR